MVGNFAVDNGHSPLAVGGVFSGLSLDSSTPHQPERVAMKLTERFKQYAAIPEQMNHAIRGFALLISTVMLIALIALAMSATALERTSRAH
jgi:hypothetical protein